MYNSIIAIVTRDGDIKCNLWTHSHVDLMEQYKLELFNPNDTVTPRGERGFACINYKPYNIKDMGNLSRYRLTIAESAWPDWFSYELMTSVRERMKLMVSKIMIKRDVEILCGGVFILAKGANVSRVKNACILAMGGSSQVGELLGSARVEVMLGSARVEVMRESCSVHTMYGVSKIGEMQDYSKVDEMYESSQVGLMRQSSNVGKMLQWSAVGVMRNASKVGGMWHHTKVGMIWDASSVAKHNSTIPLPE